MSIKQRVKSLLFYLGILSAIRLIFPRKELAVLRYHAVCSGEGHYASPFISVTPEGFRRQIRYLSSRYPILDLDEAVSRIQSGKGLPKNAIAITFDDGYRDNFSAYKILKEHDVPATFFITTNCIGDKEVFWVSEVRYLMSKTKHESFRMTIKNREETFSIQDPKERHQAISKMNRLIKSCTIPEREKIRQALRSILNDVGPLFDGKRLMLKPEEIQEMVQGGMKMGGHTLTHCNLPSAGIDAAREEIAQCRTDLEQVSQTQVTTFAYPNGGATAYFNEETKKLVNEAGYRSAWTSQHGFVDAKTDWWQSPRLAITESLVELIYLLEGDRLRMAVNKS